MAMLTCQSFDTVTWTGSVLPDNWTKSNVSNALTGRRGSQGLSMSLSTGSALYTIPSGGKATLIAQFSIQNLASLSNRDVFNFRDGGSDQVGLSLNSDGSLDVRRGATVLTTTSAGIISTSTEHYIKFSVTINNTTGAYTLNVDGTDVATGSSVDTQETGNASADEVELLYWANNAVYDDFILMDNSGSVNNAIKADCRVEALHVDAAGNSAQFTPSAGSNFQNVDETEADGDTTYNSSSTATHIDTFSHDAIDIGGGSIHAVKVEAFGRKDSGAVEMAVVVRSGTTNYFGTDTAVNTTYGGVEEMHETDPDTAAAWTESGLNSAEIGYEAATVA